MFKKINNDDIFYENLDKNYFDIILKFKNDISIVKEQKQECKQKFDAFIQNYMTPKYMWDHFGANNFSRSHEDFCQEQYRFYYRYCDDMENSVRRKRKVLQLNHSYLQQGYDVEFLLTFPNSYLDEVFEKFNMKSDIPVSKDVIKKYQKMKSLYEKIISVETNDEKWFEALTEVNDDEFVEDNIENRLGEDLTNKNLWKIYIDFLRTRNIDKLLHTYSKYCRFWLDDSEMKEEYQKAAEKYGPIKVPWKNSFEFEIYDSQYYLKIMHQNFSHPIVRKLFKHKRAKRIYSQRFPFRSNLIIYILHNSNSFVRQKLFYTCKYFFDKLPTPICYKILTKRDRKVFIGQSWDLYYYSRNDFHMIKNIYISTVLNYGIKQNSNLLSCLISRIYRCDAIFVTISGEILTFDELKFLIGHGNVEELTLNKCRITKQNGEIVPLEDIIEMNLKITSLNFMNMYCTSDITQRLAGFAFLKKFDSLVFADIKNLFEPFAFAEYIKKNASEHSDINIRLHQNMRYEEKENFILILKNAVNDHWKDNKQPFLTIF